MKGDLLLSKYAVSGKGKLYRVILDALGTAVREKEELAQYSGLSMVMNPFGALIMPRVQQENIALLIPDEEEYLGLEPRLTAVLPNRGPKSGGNRVAVTGYHLTVDAKVFFGDQECVISRRSQSDKWVLCEVPAGSGSVPVVVKSSAGTSKTIDSDYRYLNF